MVAGPRPAAPRGEDFLKVPVAPILAADRLAEPFRGRHGRGNADWIATPADAPVRRPVRAVADWLRAELGAAGLGSLGPPG